MYRESEIARSYHPESDSPLSPYNEYYPYVLLYLPSMNRFVDYEWKVVHDLSDLFSVWQLDQWKKNRQDDDLVTKDDIQMRLYYLVYEQEEEVLDFMKWNELYYGVSMDRTYPSRKYTKGE